LKTVTEKIAEVFRKATISVNVLTGLRGSKLSEPDISAATRTKGWATSPAH